MSDELSDLLSNTADGALAVDREQRIVFANEAAERLLGRSVRELVGRPCYEVMCGRDDAGRLVCQPDCPDMAAARGAGLAPTHEIAVRTKRGDETWLSVSSILVPPRRRARYVLVHLFRDVTAQKEIERGVRRLLASVARLPSARNAHAPARPPAPSDAGELTRRERQVLALMAAGTTTKEIAAELRISQATTRNHVRSILAKLGVHRQVEAVALALRHGLV
ncbi:MAG TPA: LuxR C-terminal-related transcriptional regulator [Thermodesulfobacteriota bacterium]